MSDPCEGNVDLANLEDRQRRVLAWVFAINVATFAMMVAGSVLSGSSALLSGTLDNLGDALTYALSLAVVGASARAKARVALLKGFLILAAALAVATQIAWRLTELQAPIASTMSAAAALNLVANAVCLALLTPHRDGDVNIVVVLGVLAQRRHRGRRGDRRGGRGMDVRLAMAGRARRGRAARYLPAVGDQGAAQRVARVGARGLARIDFAARTRPHHGDSQCWDTQRSA